MPSQMMIYDTSGRPVADINAGSLRSWVRNEIGTASFNLSLNDPKNKLEFLQFGNQVLITHDKLLPWVGFIADEPTGRDWENGEVHVTCFDAKQFFAWRRLPDRQYTGSAADIYRAVLADCNRAGFWPTIAEGDISAKTTQFTIEGGVMASNLFRNAARFTGWEWSVTPAISSTGLLILQANLFKRREAGSLTTVAIDESNSRVLSKVMTETGPIYNSVEFVSAADSTQARYSSGVLKDQASIGKYGLREYVAEGEGMTSGNALDAAQDWLDNFKEPRRAVPFRILNYGDTFNYMRIGNKFTWTSTIAGFTGNGIGSKETVELVSMEYDEETDEIGAVMEVL